MQPGARAKFCRAADKGEWADLNLVAQFYRGFNDRGGVDAMGHGVRLFLAFDHGKHHFG